MAIYHLSVKTISRSAGRSAPAAAAYRAGVEIADERTGEVHDYRRRSGVEHTELVLPEAAPAWNRAALWNAAEQAENRKNSTVAREFEIALPAELSAAERQRLAVDFAREIVERHGCAVDVAIHAPGGEGDDRNHHAHLLLTTRQLGPEGFGKKTRELDDQKSGEVPRWRERWAELVNDRLRENGIEARVDHRSLKAQGIERTPTIHLGPEATAIERRGERSNRGLVNRAIVEEATARLFAAQQIGQLERELAEIDSRIDSRTSIRNALIEIEERRRQRQEIPSPVTENRPAPETRFRDAFTAAVRAAGGEMSPSLASKPNPQSVIPPKKPVRAPQSDENRHPLQKEGETLEQTAQRVRGAFFEAERDAWRQARADQERQQAEQHIRKAKQLEASEPKKPLNPFAVKRWQSDHDNWARNLAEAQRLTWVCEKNAKSALSGEFDDGQSYQQQQAAADQRLTREHPELRQVLDAAAERRRIELQQKLDRERQERERKRQLARTGPKLGR